MMSYINRGKDMASSSESYYKLYPRFDIPSVLYNTVRRVFANIKKHKAIKTDVPIVSKNILLFPSAISGTRDSSNNGNNLFPAA
jgi:hypothetical protein